MPLVTAAVLYPRNSTTIDTGTGIDIRLLADAQTAAAEAQSVTNSSQGTTSERTFDPANTGVTAVASALTFQGEGYALRLAEDSTPADDTNCNAVVRAGTRTVNLAGSVAVTGTLNLGASHSLLPRASLWRYNPATDTAVLIVSGSGTTVTATAAGAWTASVSLVLANPVELLQGEVLLLQVGGLVGAGTGLLGGATSCTWTLNSNVAGTNLTFGQGHLAQVCSLTGTSAGTAAAAGTGGKVVPAMGAAAGVASASAVLGATKQSTGSATGTASATGGFGAVKGTAGSVTGTAAASGSGAVVKTTVGTVLVSSGGGSEPVTPAEIDAIATAAATKVWDELTATTRTIGSYGALVRTNVDATVSSRASSSGLAQVQTDVTTLLGRLTSTRAGLLDLLSNLDAAISTRATQAEATADPTGVTTLLGRLTTTRAALLDSLTLLDVAVSSRATPADVTGAAGATVTALQASLTAIAQQITDLAAAGVDDATTAQLHAARDELLAAIAAADADSGITTRP